MALYINCYFSFIYRLRTVFMKRQLNCFARFWEEKHTMNRTRISLNRDAVVRNLCLTSYAEWEAVKKNSR